MQTDSPTGPQPPPAGVEGLNRASTVSAPTAPPPQNQPVGARLGNSGNLRAKTEPQAQKMTRQRRYELQNTAHNLVWQHVNRTDTKRHTFTSCGKVIGATHDFAEVQVNRETGDSRLSNIAVCESIACPVCAPVRAAKAAAVLDAAIKNATLSGHGLGHITYTMRHSVDMSLHVSQDMFLEAQQKMRRQRKFRELKREFGWLESVRVMEVTRSGANGWHPHRHEVVLFERPLTVDQQQDLQWRLWICWQNALEKVGGEATDEHGLKATFGDAVAARLAEYISKHGHPPDETNTESPSAKKRSGLSMEAAVGITKQTRRTGQTPMQMLVAATDGCTRSGALWLEYYLETKQRHWMSGLKKFCDACGVDREQVEADAKEEYLQEMSDYETLTVVCQEELTAIVATRNRDRLLSLAKTGDVDDVNRFIADVLANYQRLHAQRPPPPRISNMSLDDLHNMSMENRHEL